MSRSVSDDPPKILPKSEEFERIFRYDFFKDFIR